MENVLYFVIYGYIRFTYSLLYIMLWCDKQEIMSAVLLQRLHRPASPLPPPPASPLPTQPPPPASPPPPHPASPLPPPPASPPPPHPASPLPPPPASPLPTQPPPPASPPPPHPASPLPPPPASPLLTQPPPPASPPPPPPESPLPPPPASPLPTQPPPPASPPPPHPASPLPPPPASPLPTQPPPPASPPPPHPASPLPPPPASPFPPPPPPLLTQPRPPASPFLTQPPPPASPLLTQPCPPVSAFPPPLPPLPPPPPAPALAPSVPIKKKLYQAIAKGRTAVEGDFQEACLILTQRESSFRKDLWWVLFNKYVPSLIQDGPKCGLVALWMAAHQVKPTTTMSMENITQMAVNKGYTAQGEMFSASDMALLAEEVCGFRAQRLSGGMSGDNAALILKHLTDGQPILIPYDEDFNHEPCLRSGHKAHWAVASGVLLGLAQESITSEQLVTSTTLPWLHLSHVSAPANWLKNPAEVYILAKQGKSLRYQLWKLETVARSNAQLREMDPQRAGDGSYYVLPPGGVEEGLAGQVVLLHPSQTN